MSVTDEDVKQARDMLEAVWGDKGYCGSCGWHADLSEHDVNDLQIKSALEDHNGFLHLPCINRTADDPESHRGIKIHIEIHIGPELTEQKG